MKPATLFVFKEGCFIKMNERGLNQSLSKMNERGLNQSLSQLLLQEMRQMGCLPEAFMNRGYAGRLAEKIFKALTASLKGEELIVVQVNG